MQGFPFDSYLTWDEETHLPSYDRGVSSKPLRNLIGQLFTTGVMPNPSNNLQVHAGADGMTVVVSPGFAVIEGGLCLEENSRTLAITASDPQFDRIDTVVVRWNENDSVRTADLHVVQGTPARNPIRPTLTREGSIYEIGIADIFVTKGVTTITNEKITDTRMESARCGIVSSVSEWDTTTIYQQIQGELANFKSDEEVAFANWFDYMKDQLTEDAAGKLQTEVDDVRGQIHTNLLNPILETTTTNGITCTNNGDGTYTLNGTATGWGIFDLDCNVNLKKGQTYKLTGCPKGGSSSTYRLGLYTEPSTFVIQDTGNGIEYTPTEDGVKDIHIVIHPQQTVENLVFKPMLTTDLSANYDSFVKYSGHEEKLNEQVASLHESSKGVITNLLNPTMGTATAKGLTCTRNADGTYTITGAYESGVANFFPLPAGQGYKAKSGVTYHLSGCPKGGSPTTYELIAEAELGTAYKKQYAHDYGNGVSFTVPKADIDAGYKLRITISIRSNVTNLLFKPMLTTDLDATYNDYVPYSGDGRLNENVAALFDMFHPVGTLYESVNKDFNPNTAKGWHGTWERITDCVIYAAGASDTIGSIVGSNTHTLTEAELPSHRHSTPQLTATGGKHRHSKNTGPSSYLYATTPASGTAGGTAVSGGSGTINWYEDSYTDYADNLSMTVPASNTGYTGSGTAIDMRPRRLNSVVWRRIA